MYFKAKKEFLKGIFAFGITTLMIALTRSILNQDIIFILLSISLLLIGILRKFYWKHAKLLFMGIFAQRYANQYLRQENAFTERVNIITFFIMVINFSLILLKVTSEISLYQVILLLGSITFFFILKIGIMNFLGKIFMMQDIAKLGVFFSFLFDRALGILFFPFAVMLYFFSFEITTSLFFAISIVSVVLLLLKLFWLWKIGRNIFGFSQVYIFLYLCVLEISPLLLLGKSVFY